MSRGFRVRVPLSARGPGPLAGCSSENSDSQSRSGGASAAPSGSALNSAKASFGSSAGPVSLLRARMTVAWGNSCAKLQSQDRPLECPERGAGPLFSQPYRQPHNEYVGGRSGASTRVPGRGPPINAVVSSPECEKPEHTVSRRPRPSSWLRGHADRLLPRVASRPRSAAIRATFRTRI